MKNDAINLQTAADDTAIEIAGLSKRYEIYDSPSHRLWQALSLGKAQFYREFWALRDVSINIKKGETFGIVGRNGAGKSTLLQLISGVLTPTSGHVVTRGRLTALLELGAGLNPEFSGIDNIRMGAVILGMSTSELNSKIDKIVAFAALGDFIEQPVKLYSSGMVMRLAFSVAINFDPDILIVDEALAVGDELFQLKCIRRIQEIKESGATILFVSHSTHTINQICDRAVLIDAGRASFIGPAKAVSERYTKLLFSLDTTPVETASHQDKKEHDSAEIHRSGTSEEYVLAEERMRPNDQSSSVRLIGEIMDVGVTGRDYRTLRFEQGDKAQFKMRVHFKGEARDVIMGMMITTPTGIDCYHTNLLCRDLMIANCLPGQTYIVTFDIPLDLNPGSYVAVFDCQRDMRGEVKLVDIFYEALSFNISPNRMIGDGGIASLNAKIGYRIIEEILT